MADRLTQAMLLAGAAWVLALMAGILTLTNSWSSWSFNAIVMACVGVLCGLVAVAICEVREHRG